MTDINFRFLKDLPVGKEADGFFDFYHKNVAPALRVIIENDTCVHTIGLFGRWGTGKSTIIKLLKDEGIDECKIIEFDCWKYENDSLRRQLLLQIAHDLGISRKEINKLEKDLYFIVSETVEEKIAISWAHLKKAGILSTAFILPIGFATWQLFPDFAHQWRLWVSTTLSLFLAIGLLVEKILGDDLKKIIMISPITSSKAQLNSPEQFEGSFIEMLKRANKKIKKIVIVIDNLDRVDSKVATKVLSTLKTFLEIGVESLGGRQVIFLVPCDFESIKKAAPSAELADEFLRKIFNVVLWTPEFINTDIRSFIADQIKQTGDIGKLLNDDDVFLVIESAFANSPREVKQFINNLISSLIVALKSEVKDIVEGNVAYMAKVLVLMHKYPVAFQNLKKSWYLPEAIVSTYDTKSSDEEQDPFQVGFKSFMLNTSRITVSDAEPFIYLKKPVVSTQLQDAENIRLGLIEGNEAETKKLMKVETNQTVLINFVISILDKYQNQPEILRNIFITHLVIFQEMGYSSREYINRAGTLLDRKIWPYFMEFPTKSIFDFLLASTQLDDTTKANIIERYVLTLSSCEEFKTFQEVEPLKIIISCLLAKQNLMSIDQRSRFSQAVEQFYSGSEEIVGLFISVENREILLTRKALEDFILATTLHDFQSRAKIFIGLNDLISSSRLFGILIQKIVELITQLNIESIDYNGKKETVLLHTLELVKYFKNDLKQISADDSLKFILLLAEVFNKTSDLNQLATTMNILISVGDVPDEGVRNEIKNLLIRFLKGASPDAINKVFEYWPESHIQSLIQELFIDIQDRALQDKDFASSIYVCANERTRFLLISYLINNQPDFAVAFLNSLEINEYDRVETIKALLSQAEKLGSVERVGIYDFISTKIYDNDEAAIKDTVAEQIKGLLNQDDDTNATIGFNLFVQAVFLSIEKQREIAKSTLEFLRQAGKEITINNKQSIKAISRLFSILQDTPKNDLIYLLFGLVKPDRNEDVIKMALENLVEIRPAFIHYEKDFKDLLEVLKSWNEDSSRKIVVESILQLKPGALETKDENEYWKSMELLITKNESIV